LFQILLVSFGSAIGGLTRWGVSEAFAYWFGKGFPWGTFFINVSGSLFLGWFATVLAERLPPGGWLHPDDLRLLVAMGFTGAYTTFSTFEYDTDRMIREDAGFAGMLYLLGSVALGLVAVRCGVLLARWQ
jgi:CrcB protein